MQKRGLSGVVTTVIIIAVSISLIAIIWTVISNLVETNLGTAQADLTKLSLNIIDGSEKNSSIRNFSINNHLNILGQSISIKRKVICQYVITPNL